MKRALFQARHNVLRFIWLYYSSPCEISSQALMPSIGSCSGNVVQPMTKSLYDWSCLALVIEN
jgi:hypothetical protein